MTRSKMGIRRPLLSFVIVAAVTFAESSARTKENESLMWPNTPICLAEYDGARQSVNYIRIHGLDTMTEELSTWKGWSEVDYDAVIEGKVIYPTVLVVMDYNTGGSGLGGSTKWHPGQLLMYTLAFWNSVNKAMKDIRNPRVAIQIGGLIIADSQSSSPYLLRNEGAKTFSKALSPMLDYWQKNSTAIELTNAFGSHATKFDIVVHMTNLYIYDKPPEEYSYDFHYATPETVAASQGPSCKLEGKIAGIILYDDANFAALPAAVAAMSKVLGGSDQELANPIPHALENEPCMSAPQNTLSTRGPFPPILKENLLDSWSECQIPGYDTIGGWNCRNSTSYSSLTPKNPPRVIRCRYHGEPLEAAGYSTC